MPLSERLNRIDGDREWRRHLGQRATVRAPEPEGAVGLAIDLIALLVHRAVMTATEHGEVRERGWAALRPVTDVMPLAERQPAARKAATEVPVMQRAPQRRGYRPRPGSDFHDAPIRIVPHHHPSCIARQAPRRFRGNVRPFEHRLTWLIRVREHGGIDVNHDLIALSRRAWIELVMKSRFREQRQGVSPLLSQGRALGGWIGRLTDGVVSPLLLIQRFARGFQRLDEQGARLRRQPSSDNYHAIVVLIDVERPARLLAPALTRLGLSVHAPPASHDSLDMRRGTNPRH